MGWYEIKYYMCKVSMKISSSEISKIYEQQLVLAVEQPFAVDACLTIASGLGAISAYQRESPIRNTGML